MAPRRPQDGPRTAPRRPQDLPRPPRSLRRPRKTPRTSQRTHQDPPRTPQDLPRTTPRPSQDPPRTPPGPPRGPILEQFQANVSSIWCRVCLFSRPPRISSKKAFPSRTPAQEQPKTNPRTSTWAGGIREAITILLHPARHNLQIPPAHSRPPTSRHTPYAPLHQQPRNH